MAIIIFLKTKPYNTTEKAIWSRPNQPFDIYFLHYKCTFTLRPSSRSSGFKLSGLERQPWLGEGEMTKGTLHSCFWKHIHLHTHLVHTRFLLSQIYGTLFSKLPTKSPHKAYSLPSSYPSFCFSSAIILRTPKLLPSVRTHLVFLFCNDFHTLISKSLLAVPSVH